MKRTIYASLALLAVWGNVGLPEAHAQVSIFSGGAGGTRSRPFGPTQMQMQMQANPNPLINQYQQVVSQVSPDGSLQAPLNTQASTNALGGLQTGHPTSFFNHGNYFPLVSPGGSGGGGLGSTGIGTGLNTGFGLGASNTGFGNTGFRNSGIGSNSFNRGSSIQVQPIFRP